MKNINNKYKVYRFNLKDLIKNLILTLIALMCLYFILVSDNKIFTIDNDEFIKAVTSNAATTTFSWGTGHTVTINGNTMTISGNTMGVRGDSGPIATGTIRMSPFYDYKDQIKTITSNYIILPEDSSYLFAEFPLLENVTLNLYNAGTYNTYVTNLNYMFYNCPNLKSVTLTAYPESTAVGETNLGYEYYGYYTSAAHMFDGCKKLTNFTPGPFYIVATNLDYFFNDCASLEVAQLTFIDSRELNNVAPNMFYGSSSIVKQIVTSTRTSSYYSGNTVFLMYVFPSEYSYWSYGTSTSRMMPYDIIYTSEFMNWGGTWTKDVTYYYWGTVPWRLDSDVLVLGSGTGADTNGVSPWYSYRNSIKYVTLTGFVSCPSDISYLFNQFTNLEEICYVEKFSFQYVTSFNKMFYQCAKLKKVINFSSCSFAYPSINLTSMYEGCTSLTSALYTTSWAGQAYASSTSAMFKNCTSLTRVDLTGITMNSTDASYMFYGCTSLNDPTFSTISDKTMSNIEYMFYGCDAMTSISWAGTDITAAIVNRSTSNIYAFTNRVTRIYLTETYLGLGASGTTGSSQLTNLFPDQGGWGRTTTETLSPSEIYNLFYTGSISSTGTWFNLTSPNKRYWGTCPYIIESNVLKVYAGTGANTSGTSPWSSSASTITRVEFYDVIFPADSSALFKNFKALLTVSFSNINTSNVTNMSNMFYYCNKITTLDLTSFNTSNVTNMSYMFNYCSALTSLNLSNFSTGKVTTMAYMFRSCSALTSLNVSGWANTLVTNMTYMFAYCSSLTTLNLTNFYTPSVTNMSNMFYGCSRLTSINVTGFDTAKVTTMAYMFYNCSSLTTLSVAGWSNTVLTNVSYMFYNCSALTTLNLTGFNTSNVTTMSNMFRQCSALTTLDVSGFNTTKVTSTYQMFYNCSALTTLDVSRFNTSKVTTTSQMFYNCSALTSLDLSDWTNNLLSNMSSMFYNCTSLETLNLTNFATPSATNMSGMFLDCQSLTSLDLSSFNTENVTDMGSMFASCTQLQNLDLSNFTFGETCILMGLTQNCTNLISIDLSSLESFSENNFNPYDMSQEASNFFTDCSNLKAIKLSNASLNSAVSNAYLYILPISSTLKWYNVDRGLGPYTAAEMQSNFNYNYDGWWKLTYTLQYNANGGTGTTSSYYVPLDEEYTILSNNFTRTDYTFKNWNTNSYGTGTAYTPGQVLTSPLGNEGDTVVLYAIWESDYGTIRYDFSVTNTTAAYIDAPLTISSPSLESMQVTIKIYNNSDTVRYTNTSWSGSSISLFNGEYAIISKVPKNTFVTISKSSATWISEVASVNSGTVRSGDELPLMAVYTYVIADTNYCISGVSTNVIPGVGFNYTVTDHYDEEYATGISDGLGTVTFTGIPLTRSDLGTNLILYIAEEDGGSHGVVYDSDIKTIVLNITEDGKGNIVVTQNPTSVVFNNTTNTLPLPDAGGTLNKASMIVVICIASMSLIVFNTKRLKRKVSSNINWKKKINKK